MTEEQKQQVAVFRFGIIHDFVGGARLDFGERDQPLDFKYHIDHNDCAGCNANEEVSTC